MIAASDSADVLLPATHVPFHTTAAFQPFNGIVVVVFLSHPPPPLHTTNTFPGSGSTCAQGICLCVSQQISLGQGLRLASRNRLLKTAPQQDERGKWIFQLKSRIVSAQGISLCSKRLIKWDAIDTAPRCSWISAGHVHCQLLAWKMDRFYMWKTHIHGCFLSLLWSCQFHWDDKCNTEYNLRKAHIFENVYEICKNQTWLLKGQFTPKLKRHIFTLTCCIKLQKKSVFV